MKKEYFEALKELKIARNHFDNALPEYIDAAIMELLMAEAKVGAVYHE